MSPLPRLGRCIEELEVFALLETKLKLLLAVEALASFSHYTWRRVVKATVDPLGIKPSSIHVDPISVRAHQLVDLLPDHVTPARFKRLVYNLAEQLANQSRLRNWAVSCRLHVQSAHNAPLQTALQSIATGACYPHLYFTSSVVTMFLVHAQAFGVVYWRAESDCTRC